MGEDRFQQGYRSTKGPVRNFRIGPLHFQVPKKMFGYILSNRRVARKTGLPVATACRDKV